MADGVVAETLDGVPLNVPGEHSRAVPITLENIGGNHIVLDIGAGHYAFYAHLQPGSLRVKLGDRVRRGQVLGLVGNTGNSTSLTFTSISRMPPHPWAPKGCPTHLNHSNCRASIRNQCNC